MKIVVPIKKDETVNGHFGHSEEFMIFTVSDTNTITGSEHMQAAKEGVCKSTLAADFAKQGVSVLLAGGIGDGALSKLNAQGITVIRNCDGKATDLVNQYLAGELKDGGSSCEHHHEHHEHHHQNHQCNHHNAE